MEKILLTLSLALLIGAESLTAGEIIDVACGSVFQVKASEVFGNSMLFTSKPAVYFQTAAGKKIKIKVLNKSNEFKAGTDTLECLVVTGAVEGDYPLYVITNKNPKLVTDSFRLHELMITSISHRSVKAGDMVTVVGNWFGSRAPVLRIEYGGQEASKSRSKSCKVLKPYKYADAYDKKGKSVMNVSSGVSGLTFVVPKPIAENMPAILTISNPIASRSFQFNKVDRTLRLLIFDPRYSYSVKRNEGESRFGSVGTTDKYGNAHNPEYKPVFHGTGLDMLGALSFSYSFDAPDNEEYKGIWFSFGRTAIELIDSQGNPNGKTQELYKDSTFNLNDYFQISTDKGYDIDALSFTLTPNGQEQKLVLKFEMEDKDKNKQFTRRELDCSGTSPIELLMPLSDFILSSGSFDQSAVKLISIVVEENNFADHVSNPISGEFDINEIALLDYQGPHCSAGDLSLIGDDKTLVAEIAKKDFEAILRLFDPVPGAVVDRTLFRDLYHWGATGWLIASLPGAVNMGWIEREKAAELTLKTLIFLDKNEIWGNRPAGMVGNSVGMIYRFGGFGPDGLEDPLTGTRKIDNGNVNAVEASTIDTGLILISMIVPRVFFDSSDNEIEIEIRDRIDNLLERIQWNSILGEKDGAQQFRMAWKPEACGGYQSPADFAGFWASKGDNSPLCIDYYTDEGKICAILACPVAGSAPWYGLINPVKNGAVLSWPGAWFTYNFLCAEYLPPDLGVDKAGIDWNENTRKIFDILNHTPGAELYLPDAVELPDASYLAQGDPSVAVDIGAPYTGTISIYSIQIALGLGDSKISKAALAQLRKILSEDPDVWDPYWGFLDAYHPDLSDPRILSRLQALKDPPALRFEGKWCQQQVFSLNKGAALCAQLNYLLDGYLTKLISEDSMFNNSIDAIYGTATGEKSLRTKR